MPPHETDGVRIVHHHQRAVLLGEVADRGQVGDIAVHGEHAVGGDQAETRAGGLGQLGIEVGHVVVQVAEPLGFAQADAVNDAGVVQLIGNDRVLRPEQRLEQAAVGVEAGGVKDGVFGAEELADLGLELLVDALGAADEADAGHAVAPLVNGRLRRRRDRRMLRQPQVIVGAQVEHRLAVGHADGGALGRDDDAFALVCAGGANTRQL